MTRMTAARLAEIESATRYESGNRNPIVQAVYKELLAELREVTRERDEALKANERLYKDCVDYAVNIWSLKEESDALRAELTRRQLVKDEDDETIASLRDRVAQLEQALELIASPKRKDGTYNRSREACEQLARAALNPVKAGTSVCRHSVPTDRKCLDCATLKEK